VLSAIVPATDRPATLARCVEALRAADEPPDEVIVVEEPSRAGPAEARNRGAARARGDVLLFVDADVLVHRDAVARVRARLRDDPGLAGVFGSYDAEPAAPGLVSRFRNLLHHQVHQEGAGPALTFWAGLGALRRDAFEPFDAGRFRRASIEDVELGLRLTAAGAGGELDPRIRETHLKAWTLGGMLRTDLLDRGVPWVELALRTRSFPPTLNLGRRHRLSAAASLGLAAGVAARRPGLALPAAAVLLTANRDFYALLALRLGPGGAAAGIGLHVLHHLTAVAAVPLGTAAYLRDRAADAGGAPAARAPS
jgi:glycosyltransferase involved in cell wall biosynthesis